MPIKHSETELIRFFDQKRENLVDFGPDDAKNGHLSGNVVSEWSVTPNADFFQLFVTQIADARMSRRDSIDKVVIDLRRILIFIFYCMLKPLPRGLLSIGEWSHGDGNRVAHVECPYNAQVRRLKLRIP